jgi:uncharacterized protein (DUF3820 family)
MTDIIPLVPFGKYKGKPITEMMGDTGYINWLKQQTWFTNKKQSQIYNIVVNQQINPTQTSNTPEHNSLQNLFLDKNNIVQFYKYIYTNIIKDKYSNCVFRSMEKGYENPPKPEFEGCFNWDVVFDGNFMAWNKHKDNCDHKEDENCNKSCFYDNDDNDYDTYSIYIEIKPLVGDDYPTILRKMKTQIELTHKKMMNEHEKLIKQEKDIYNWDHANWLKDKSKAHIGRYFLLIKDFQSSTTTIDELKKIFSQTGIYVVFFRDIFKDIFKDISISKEVDVSSAYVSNVYTVSNISDNLMDTKKNDIPDIPDIESYKLLEKRIIYLENLVIKMANKIGLTDEEKAS